MPRQRLLAWWLALGVPLAAVAGADVEPSGLALLLLGCGGAVAIADWFADRRQSLEVAVTTDPLLRLTEDRPGELALVIRARSQRPLRLAPMLPEGLESPLPEAQLAPAPDAAGRVAWPLTARARGRYRIAACRIESASPLGLWSRRSTLPLDTEVRVYPDLTRDRELAAMFLRRGSLGSHVARQLGKGREFEKLREYQPGDGWGDIHWKASARRGELMTKEYQVERTQDVFAVLDRSRLSAQVFDGRPAIDGMVRAALALAWAARRHGDRFGLAVVDDRVRTFLPAGNGAHHFDAAREALVGVAARRVSPDFGEIAATLRTRVRRRSLLVFLTDLSDPAVADDFLATADLLGRRHLAIVAMGRPSGVAPLEDHPVVDRPGAAAALAGQLVWTELRQLERRLARSRVELALVEHPALAASVVSKYVSIKRRQLL